jgi:type IV secretory pathway VirB2 component (pilin)
MFAIQGALLRAQGLKGEVYVMSKSILVAALWLVSATPALAYTPTGLPWDGPLSMLINGMEGGLAHAMLAVGVIVAGIGWTFWQEFGPAAKALVGVISGGALAGAALNIMTYLGLAAVIR